MNSINRRRFLQNAGLGLTAFALSRNGQLLGSPYGMPIGLQLYTVRDHMEKDLEGTLKRVAEIGYQWWSWAVSTFMERSPQSSGGS